MIHEEENVSFDTNAFTVSSNANDQQSHQVVQAHLGEETESHNASFDTANPFVKEGNDRTGPTQNLTSILR